MLQQDSIDAHLLSVEAYDDHSVTIDGQSYPTPILITPKQIISGPIDADFQQVIDLKPDVFLLGTGDTFKLPEPSTLSTLYDAGIGVEAMSNLAACRTHVALLSEGRRVISYLK